MFGDPDKKKSSYTYCEKCGERLYYSKGFNVLDNQKLCNRCYRNKRVKKFNNIEKQKNYD